MARFLEKRNAAEGKAPGTLVYIGSPKESIPQFQWIEFDESRLEESQGLSNQLSDLPDEKDNVLWLNITGIHDKDMVEAIGTKYQLHDLVLENVMNTAHRPRLEEYDNCIFITLKMLRYEEKRKIVISEQVSIIIKKNLVITFQEEIGDVFDPLRERIRKSRGRVRKSGTDYLAFALLDIVFDRYISTVEIIGGDIEDLEKEILRNPEKILLEKINQFKLEINYLRKSIRPAKELSFQFAKIENQLIKNHTRQYMRELVANATEANEVIDSYSNLLTDFLTVYHAAIGAKANEVMRVLTIFASIFIPLTFVAGVYGTNFKYLPELEYKYAYPVFWGILIVISLFMLRFFRNKKWL